jgi:hypothetical protein
MMNLTFTANPGSSEDDTVGPDLRSVPDSNITLHKGARADFNLRSKLGFRVNNGGWVHAVQDVLLPRDFFRNKIPFASAFSLASAVTIIFPQQTP